MAPPLVLRVPKANVVYAMLVRAVPAGFAVYVIVSVDSAFARGAGALVLLLSLPCVIIGAVQLRREPQTVTVRDDGLEVPTLGRVAWSEITELKIDEQGLDLAARSGHVRVGRLWTTLKTKDLRAEIAARSGGSWFDGKWTSRAS
jgi:hypothetical protein